MRRYVVDFDDYPSSLVRNPDSTAYVVDETSTCILGITKSQRVIFPMLDEGSLSSEMIRALSEAWVGQGAEGDPSLIMTRCNGRVGLGLMLFDGVGATEIDKFPFEGEPVPQSESASGSEGHHR